MVSIDRYPIQPLLHILELRGATTLRTMANQLNITDRTLRVHLDTATLWWATADEYACRLGYHPLELWPTWLNDQADETATNAA